ncbi:MAG: hypothetical protein M3019_12505 [Candidatus Dormibacteraeota bacterium]|nr:hypothetical protein [Candidatus Dormibacteraeota bacterium]
MEIRDYLRAIRRWLWLPVVMPLVAGAATGALMLKQPAKYQADATVVVPAVAAKGFSTSAAAQYVATFKDVLISQPLVQAVSNATKVPIKDLVGGLTATTVTASSNIIHVTYIGPVKSSVADVVRAATVATLDTVAQPQLVQAQNALNSGQTSLAKADAAITQYTTNTGLLFPDQDFKIKQAELSQLLLQLQQSNIAGDSKRAAALQAIITQRQAELATLATQVGQYTSLTEQRQASLTVLSHDQQLLADAQALLTANHDPKTISVANLGKVSRVGDVLRFTAIAAAVALILALALILLKELLRARRPAVVSTGASSSDARADSRIGSVGAVPTGFIGTRFRRRAVPRPAQPPTMPPAQNGAVASAVPDNASDVRGEGELAEQSRQSASR